MWDRNVEWGSENYKVRRLSSRIRLWRTQSPSGPGTNFEDHFAKSRDFWCSLRPSKVGNTCFSWKESTIRRFRPSIFCYPRLLMIYWPPSWCWIRLMSLPGSQHREKPLAEPLGNDNSFIYYTWLISVQWYICHLCQSFQRPQHWGSQFHGSRGLARRVFLFTRTQCPRALRPGESEEFSGFPFWFSVASALYFSFSCWNSATNWLDLPEILRNSFAIRFPLSFFPGPPAPSRVSAFFPPKNWREKQWNQ